MNPHHDPDEKGDDDWGLWGCGFLCGLAACAVVYLLARLMS